jgi:hypothetical protein
MQHDPVTRGLGADETAARVVEQRQAEAPIFSAARDDQIFAVRDGARKSYSGFLGNLRSLEDLVESSVAN